MPERRLLQFAAVCGAIDLVLWIIRIVWGHQ